MAKTDILNIRIDPKLKKQVEKTLSELGMNTTEAITIFLKQVVLTKSIPFDVRIPKYNIETIGTINEARKIAEDSAEYHYYDTVEDLMEDLNN